MNAAIEAAKRLFRKKDFDRQTQLDQLAGRLLDGEEIAPEKLEAVVDALGFTEAELESTIVNIKAKRERDQRQQELQAIADQYETLRAQYRQANEEHEELIKQRDEHIAAMKREVGESSRILDEFRQRIQQASEARDRLRREFGASSSDEKPTLAIAG